MLKEGKIVKIISNLYTVKCNESLYETRARGKFRNMKVSPLVGDFVSFDENTKCIIDIKPRINVLSRPSVANVDVAVIVTSSIEPTISYTLLDRQIACIEYANIMPVICLTKLDLLDEISRAKLLEEISYYSKIGYSVFTNTEIDEIKKHLRGKTVLLTGQTGAGKSSLINRLGDLDIKTSPISRALGRGVHTTRHTEIYNLDGIDFIDTPGFSALDLDITTEELCSSFIEFDDSLCKYKGCMHDKEPECHVKSLVEAGEIKKSRYENYLKFRGEL